MSIFEDTKDTLMILPEGWRKDLPPKHKVIEALWLPEADASVKIRGWVRSDCIFMDVSKTHQYWVIPRGEWVTTPPMWWREIEGMP